MSSPRYIASLPVLPNTSLLIALSTYEQVIRHHTDQWTADHNRTVSNVREWCEWHEHTYGEALTTTHLAQEIESRHCAEQYRDHCHKFGSPESFRRKREHIRRFLRWCIRTHQVAHDPFEQVLPMTKRTHLLRPHPSRQKGGVGKGLNGNPIKQS